MSNDFDALTRKSENLVWYTRAKKRLRTAPGSKTFLQDTENLNLSVDYVKNRNEITKPSFIALSRAKLIADEPTAKLVPAFSIKQSFAKAQRLHVRANSLSIPHPNPPDFSTEDLKTENSEYEFSSENQKYCNKPYIFNSHKTTPFNWR